LIHFYKRLFVTMTYSQMCEIGKVAVIGAGVIGLSTALHIQELLPEVKVTIFSADLSPDTTADGAAGIFGLYLMGSTPLPDQVRWAQITHDWMERLWKSPLCGKYGISLVSSTRLNHSPVPPPWEDVVYGLRTMDKKELERIGRLQGSHASGLEFGTFTAEPVRFLPLLMDRFLAGGGSLVKRKVETLGELGNQYQVIVNCAGLGARSLVGDQKINPLRGQVARVSAPWLRKVVLDDRDDGNYVIPNQDSVVVGGTHQDGDWDTNPRQDDKEFILAGGKAMEPSLAGAKHLKDWVGLRPGRPSVRLERETMSDGVGGVQEVVHNYGHGGSGITVFQGCAEDAAKLVQDVLTEKTFSVPRNKL